MQAKSWVLNGAAAALLALGFTYFLLEPAPNPIRYGVLLGWSGMIGVLIVLVQGYRRVEKQPTNLDRKHAIVGFKVGLSRWGAIHTALSVAVTVIIAVHAVVFFSSLWSVSIAIWLGATAFITLLVLNASGPLTEAKRGSRGFGSLKKLHVVLMSFVIVLSVLHIELLVGPMFAGPAISGSIIALAVAFVVFLVVPMRLDGQRAKDARMI